MSGVDAVAGGPYLNFPQPTSIGLNLQSGGQISSSGDVAKHATVGIWLGDNDARFQTGMIFKHTGLVGTDGAGTGTATAIAFAQGHTVQWFQPNNVPGSRIFSQQTANSPLDLVFGNGLAYLQDSNGSLPLLGVQGGRPAAGNTAMLVLVGGASGSVSYAPVSVGAPDSAGSGYRTLRVAN
jgi:hypothetical protein